MMHLVHKGMGYTLVCGIDRSDRDDEKNYGKLRWSVRWEGGSRTGPFKTWEAAQAYGNMKGGRWMLAEPVKGGA